MDLDVDPTASHEQHVARQLCWQSDSKVTSGLCLNLIPPAAGARVPCHSAQHLHPGHACRPATPFCTPIEPSRVQVAVSRRVSFINTLQFGRENHSHLHGLFLCLRLGREEEYRVAKQLCDIVVGMPKEGKGCWRDLHVNGRPAAVAEDAKMWASVNLIARERKVPDASWDPKETLEFTLVLPSRWLRTAVASRIQVRTPPCAGAHH